MSQEDGDVEGVVEDVTLMSDKSYSVTLPETVTCFPEKNGPRLSLGLRFGLHVDRDRCLCGTGQSTGIVVYYPQVGGVPSLPSPLSFWKSYSYLLK